MEVVKTVFAEVYPFRGVENYFTDAILYQESHEVVKENAPVESDSGNEADSEPEITLDDE